MRSCYVNRRKLKAVLQTLAKGGREDFISEMTARHAGKFKFIAVAPTGHPVLLQGEDYRSIPKGLMKFIGKRN